MKNYRSIFIYATIVVSMLLAMTLEARGGRGGGGGGGRGGGGGGRGGSFGGGGGLGGGGQNFSRGPSMSRAQVPQRTNYNFQPQRQVAQQPRIQQPQFQQRQIQQPQLQNRSQILQSGDQRFAQAGQGLSQARPGQSREQLQQFRQNSGAIQRQDRTNIGNRDAINNIKQQLPANIADRNRTAQDIRNNINNVADNRNWFDGNFWNNHNYHPDYWNGAGNYWAAASWAGVNDWLGYGWSDPVYYEEGYPVYVNSGEGTSYLATDSSQYVSPQAQPSQNVAYTEPPAQTTQPQDGQQQASGDWLPLGVFALVNDVNDASNANMFFQLALGKDGTIAGSYYNKSIDKVYPLDGMVDKASQEAVWKMATGENPPVFETGVFNLTKDQTSVDVTFSDGSKQSWLMIRI